MSTTRCWSSNASGDAAVRIPATRFVARRAASTRRLASGTAADKTNVRANGRPRAQPLSISHAMDATQRHMPSLALLLFVTLLAGCAADRTASSEGADHAAGTLRAARNEWIGFAVDVDGAGRADVMAKFREAGAPQVRGAWLVVDLPVDGRTASAVRRSGPDAVPSELPRALLPMRETRAGQFEPPRVAAARRARAVWIDVFVPTDVAPGVHTLVVRAGSRQREIAFAVDELVLPARPTVTLIGRTTWDALGQLDRALAGASPQGLGRADDEAARRLDRLVSMVHEHRGQLWIADLGPTTKWPPGEPPSIDFAAYDALIGPWMHDDAPLAAAMPGDRELARFDLRTRQQYWREVAAHFDGRRWLERSLIALDGDVGARAALEAAAVVAAHPAVRVVTPLSEDRLPLGEGGLSRPDAARLIVRGGGVLREVPLSAWDASTPRPGRWFDIGRAGFDQASLRRQAMLAVVPDADGAAPPRAELLVADAVAPTSPPPLAPERVHWFYPGSWFGVEEPVPSIQLKWSRRAQQDLEYLLLAMERGATPSAVAMAQVAARPLLLSPGAPAEPAAALLAGETTDEAMEAATALLSRLILARPPAGERETAPDPAIEMELERWRRAHGSASLRAARTQWLLEGGGHGSTSLSLRLGVEVYRPSRGRTVADELAWAQTPTGWTPGPPVEAPTGRAFEVRPVALDARVDPPLLASVPQPPARLRFTDAFDGAETIVEAMAPAASILRRAPPRLDGALGDWTSDDAIHRGRLTRALRSGAAGRVEPASTDSAVYAAWSEAGLHLAFHVEASWQSGVHGNVVRYDDGRAWGEDLCQVLVQAVTDDRTEGKWIHVVAKPTTHDVERLTEGQWRPAGGSVVRYAATRDGDVWRAEMTIPWEAMGLSAAPALVKFNFTQHRDRACETSSFAGPIDHGRDTRLTGALLLRDER